MLLKIEMDLWKPRVVKKHQKDIPTIDDKIISTMLKGLSYTSNI